MKLAASLIVRNERGRYLEECVGHLLEFCDEVRVLDDASTDGSFEWLAEQWAGVEVVQLPASRFFEHEGRTRQALLEWTLQGDPSHVLALDADEFVADGAALRQAVESRPDLVAFTLDMREVWEADTDGLCIREDGGWHSHGIPALWRVPDDINARPGGGPSWQIADRALACGRVPAPIDNATAYLGLPGDPVTDILHFGWANEAERAARYQRYADADGGRFHARRHLDSIMWGCDQVQLRPMDWPASLASRKDAILERANGVRA